MRAVVRSVLAGVVVGVVFAALAPAAAAKDAGFPDLPGMSSVQRLTDTKGAATEVSGTASSATTQNITKPDRTATAASASDVKSAKTADVPDQNAVIRNLPAGGILPVLGAEPASSRGSDGMLLAFAAMVVVCFTRFLFRLNTLGRPA